MFQRHQCCPRCQYPLSRTLDSRSIQAGSDANMRFLKHSILRGLDSRSIHAGLSLDAKIRFLEHSIRRASVPIFERSRFVATTVKASTHTSIRWPTRLIFWSSREPNIPKVCSAIIFQTTCDPMLSNGVSTPYCAGYHIQHILP